MVGSFVCIAEEGSRDQPFVTTTLTSTTAAPAHAPSRRSAAMPTKGAGNPFKHEIKYETI
jgi:hypothetical protein